ncbi:MAG: AsmA family protein, partial [Rhodospirillaceae bacterium]|nr:AsmA family protein [Rhodospirillaceae bacterium]
MARGLKYARNALGLLAGVVISLTAVLYFVDFNEYRGLLATRLSEELGRPLRIDGDLKLRLGLHTGFSASGLSLAGNADGSGENMAKIGRLSFGLALRPLLDRKIEIDQLQIEDAEILIEQAPDGSLNWALGQGGDATSAWSLPRIDDLRV